MAIDLDKMIQVLFGSSSLIDEERQDEWNLFVQSMWRLVCLTLGEKPSGEPELRIVRGKTARPQILSSGGLDYLVYDESLDPWLARLTELAAKKLPFREALLSLLQLLSKRHLANGHLVEAVRDSMAIPAWEMATFIDRAVNRNMDTDDPIGDAPNTASDRVFRFDIHELVRMQREFVITHELVHIFFQRFPDRLADVMTDFRRTVVALDRRKPWTEDLVRQIDDAEKADFIYAWERRTGSKLTPEQVSQITRPADTGPALDLFDRMLAEANEDPDFLQECICDLVASMAMLIARRGTPRLRLSLIVVGGSMALQNMRLIQAIDKIITADLDAVIPVIEDHSSTQFTGSYMTAQLRLDLYRDGWSVLANFTGDSPRLPIMLGRALTKWNRLHHTYVLDPYGYTFWPDYPERFTHLIKQEEVRAVLDRGLKSAAAQVQEQHITLDEAFDFTRIGKVDRPLVAETRDNATQSPGRAGEFANAVALHEAGYADAAIAEIKRTLTLPQADNEPKHLTDVPLACQLAAWQSGNGEAMEALNLIVYVYAQTKDVFWEFNIVLRGWITSLEIRLEPNSRSTSTLEGFIREQADEGASQEIIQELKLRLAEAYVATGQFDNATDVLVEMAREPTRNMPINLQTQEQLAALPDAYGDTRQTADRWRALAADRITTFGPRHPDTLRTRYLAANRSYVAGEMTEAAELLTTLVVDQERAYGPADVRTLRSRQDLCVLAASLKGQSAAIGSMGRLEAEVRQLLGPTHPVTLDMQRTLSDLQISQNPPSV